MTTTTQTPVEAMETLLQESFSEGRTFKEAARYVCERQPQAARLTEEEATILQDVMDFVDSGEGKWDHKEVLVLAKALKHLTAAPSQLVTKLDHPCGDMECNKDRENKMVRVGTYDSKPVFCDPCIAPIVQALNDGGIRTIASCCGHNRRPATLAIEGDRWLALTDRKGMEQIAAIFPGDINGEERAARQVTREEIARVMMETPVPGFAGDQYYNDASAANPLADAIMSLPALRGLVKEG